MGWRNEITYVYQYLRVKYDDNIDPIQSKIFAML